jgi:hypothetical protein
MLSTLSVNRDDIAGAEDLGWMLRRRIVSIIPLNWAEGISAEDMTWNNQH